MISSRASNKRAGPARLKEQDSRVTNNSLGHDFALLGLRSSEARVEVIHQAAKCSADRIHSAVLRADHDVMISRLATSIYRLLDPRRRTQATERIQLCVQSEEDWDRQNTWRRPLVNRLTVDGDDLVPAELVEPFD